MRRRAAVVIVLAACARPAAAPQPATHLVSSGGRVHDETGPPVRIALALSATDADIAATGAWRVYELAGSVLARGGAGERWRLERGGARLRLVRDDGTRTAWGTPPLILRTVEANAMPLWRTRRYRGELAFTLGDSGIVVANRVPLEAYLRGVVPIEMGERAATDRAAVEAQAVAARSYTVARLRETVARDYDLLATVTDQAYGGADAERPIADEAIARTEGEVLSYARQVVSAPFHSTCGGSTADPTEVWRAGPEPYLTRVSDRIPGTDRFWCDIAPRFRWERTFDAAQLEAVLDRYLRAYASNVPAGPLGAVRSVEIDGRTPSGRAAAILVSTERGRWRVRGNDIRFVLRAPSGELLNSTYFSLEPSVIGGTIGRLVVRGTGYGHGVGMCQWGAIGRARAGQDYRAILATYYPGTNITRVE